MPVHLHRADSTALLADELAELLTVPLPDPFAEEFVVVPARGVERWLTQRLSHRLGARAGGADGVCAGVRFVNPRSLVALLTGTDRGAGSRDPWDPDRLVWPLLEVIDASLDEPWCASLASHLGHGRSGVEAELRQERRYSVARRLAGLFASYVVQRPSLISAWRAGEDHDGEGAHLAPDLLWQPRLWRALLERVDAAPPDERHQSTLARIQAGDELDLPDRLSLFGHTRLPITEIELIRAVAERRDVHLWLPQVSGRLWEQMSEAAQEGPVRRDQDVSANLVEHPLLSSLGRDSRELRRTLGVLGSGSRLSSTAEPMGLTAEPMGSGSRLGSTADVVVEQRANSRNPDSLLGWLQHDLRANIAPDPTGRVVASDDRSIQIHSCHGTSRQVDVLREVLVGLLQDDDELEPRDILVMCPDIETYAPLFQAGFGLAGLVDGGHPGHELRVRLADRGLANTNPLLALATQLVELAGGRATATQVLDLAAAEPVRTRFGFGDDDLATIANWVEAAGIRWGLTGQSRERFGLDGIDQNTWRSGLDRVLLGVAMAEEDRRWLGSALPLDDVASASVDLAGRLGEFVDRVQSVVEDLRVSVPVSHWAETLVRAVHGLGAVAPKDAWQVSQFEREIESLSRAHPDSNSVLRLGDIRALLRRRLSGRPTRANFRTGALTVSTMVPMRSVPHRVICLVGLDDGVFPRVATADGDDVLARDPMTGERDPRSEDRQLLLDAILAAQDKLVITYTGANEHSGQARPPAVPLGELIDALEATALPSEKRTREHVVVEHPLQPFDPRNLEAGVLGSEGPFSFDSSALAAALAAAGPRHPRPPLLTNPLVRRDQRDIVLSDLQAFFAHPARAFLRQRLDLAAPDEYEEVRDAIPVEVNALDDWAVGDRILRQALAGADRESVFTAELLRGELPPGKLGERLHRQIATRVIALLGATTDFRGTPPRARDVTVDLGGGRRITGVVPDVRGNRIVRVHYSKLGPKHRLASWLDLVALSAALDDSPWTALTVGWHKSKSPQMSLLGPLDHTAIETLRALVDVYDRGMREPIPLPLRTAYAYADTVRAGRNAYRPGSNAWESPFDGGIPGEQDDRYNVAAFGAKLDFDDLLGTPLPGEDWNAESTRLGQYALRVWGPLFAAEQVRQA